MGHFISSLMGSGAQVLVPLAVIIVFYRQPDYFGMSVGGFWLSFSLFELARYVGDARAMDLPLVGLSDDPEHDWHYLLSTTHLLAADTFFAFLIRAAATLIGAASLAFAVWLLWQMCQGAGLSPGLRPPSPRSAGRGGTVPPSSPSLRVSPSLCSRCQAPPARTR
jgi:hypothetical protein